MMGRVARKLHYCMRLRMHNVLHGHIVLHAQDTAMANDRYDPDMEEGEAAIAASAFNGRLTGNKRAAEKPGKSLSLSLSWLHLPRDQNLEDLAFGYVSGMSVPMG